jgi:hypothetical protein
MTLTGESLALVASLNGTNRKFLPPHPGLVTIFSPATHGLRRGLHSFAASRLGQVQLRRHLRHPFNS